MKHPYTYWMPIHTGEFLAETSTLTTHQIGAYLLLLVHYWHKRCLPADNRHLARIAKSTVRGWLNIRPAIAPLFYESGGMWSHPRLDAELAKRDQIHIKRAVAGTKGGHVTGLKAMSASVTRHTKTRSHLHDKEAAHIQANLLNFHKPK